MSDIAYILAASHSGSTLLAMLLGSHPQAVTVGELSPSGFGDVNGYRCSCGALLRECGFWKRVSHEMSERGARFDLTDFRTRFQNPQSPVTRRLLRPLYRGARWEMVRDMALAMCPSWHREFRLMRHNVQSLTEAITKVSRRQVIIDSSKCGVQLKYLLSIPALRVKVVRLIRDGRAVALTYTDPSRFADAQDPRLRNGGTGAINGRHVSMTQAAYEWRRSNEEAEQLLASLGPSRWIEVRYEELCDKPQATLDRVFEFLALDPKRAVKNFRDVEHHVLGNGMRLDAARDVRLDERWKSQLTPDDLRTFDAVAGQMNSQYGYD